MRHHENFLKRVTEHEKLAHDHDLRIFLTYKGDLEVRSQNAQEKVKGFFKSRLKNHLLLIIEISYYMNEIFNLLSQLQNQPMKSHCYL